MKIKKKRLIIDIIFYVVIAIIYVFTIVSIVMRANGGTLYLFNNRFDVVLSNSMSYRNSKYVDFLEGTSQFQKDDVLISSRVDNNTEIKLKDVIMFKSQEYGGSLIAHRVVDVIEKGTLFTIKNATATTYKSQKCFKLNSLDSLITLASTSVRKLEFEYCTDYEYEPILKVRFGEDPYTATYESTKIDDYYLHKCEVTRKNPFTTDTYIELNVLKDAYITKIAYTINNDKVYTFNGNEYESKTDSYQKRFDYELLFETRGDANASSESQKLPRENVIAKVHTVVPQFGKFIRFITSIYGIILLVGAGVILTVNSILIDKFWKKKEIASIETKPIDKEEEEIDETKEQIDHKD